MSLNFRAPTRKHARPLHQLRLCLSGAFDLFRLVEWEAILQCSYDPYERNGESLLDRAASIQDYIQGRGGPLPERSGAAIEEGIRAYNDATANGLGLRQRVRRVIHRQQGAL